MRPTEVQLRSTLLWGYRVSSVLDRAVESDGEDHLDTIQPLLPWSGGAQDTATVALPCSQSPEHLLHFPFHRPRLQLARIAGKWAFSRWPVESHRPPQIRRRALPASAATQYGPLAQLVEQETLNLLVVGSIPTRPTTNPLILLDIVSGSARPALVSWSNAPLS